MTDHITSEHRSWNMSRITSEDTEPEMRVRRAAHALGYRFRLHGKQLPGKPDLVFAGRKAVIFVHGCFWHRHEGCRRCTTPQSRQDYWLPKFARTVERDRRTEMALIDTGWHVLTIWECETGDETALRETLTRFLEPLSPPAPRRRSGTASANG